MTRLTFITIAFICCILSYYAGRANPSDYHAAKLTAAGYDAGRQAAIDEIPRQTPPAPTAKPEAISASHGGIPVISKMQKNVFVANNFTHVWSR